MLETTSQSIYNQNDNFPKGSNQVTSTNNKVPRIAYFALSTSLLYILLFASYMVIMLSKVPSKIGAISINSGPQYMGLLLISAVGMIFPLLTLINIILGVMAFNYSRKHPNIKTALIGIFSFIVGIIPVILFLWSSLLFSGF